MIRRLWILRFLNLRKLRRLVEKAVLALLAVVFALLYAAGKLKSFESGRGGDTSR